MFILIAWITSAASSQEKAIFPTMSTIVAVVSASSLIAVSFIPTVINVIEMFIGMNVIQIVKDGVDTAKLARQAGTQRHMILKIVVLLASSSLLPMQ